MRILIAGSGGIGGFFGAKLAAAGAEVTFMARGRHRAAMVSTGLQVLSPSGDVRIERPAIFDPQNTEGHFDAVIVCTKLWSLQDIATEFRNFVHDETAVVPLQNGVDAADSLAEILGDKPVLGGVARISSAIEAPGVIRHASAFGRMIFGELDGRTSSRVKALDALAQKAEIGGAATDIRKQIWEKFIMLAPLAGACCYLRLPLGATLAQGRPLLLALTEEACAVARAKGEDFPANMAPEVVERSARLPAGMKPSMLLDLEQGNRLELEWLTGAVVRIGVENAVPVPESQKVYENLKPFAEGSA